MLQTTETRQEQKRTNQMQKKNAATLLLFKALVIKQ